MRALCAGMAFLPPLLLLAACGEPEQAGPPKPAESASPPPKVPAAKPAVTAPAGKGAPPTAQGAAASDDAQGAASTLRTYYAFIAAGKYPEANALRESSPEAPDAEAFARNFDRYREHHANVGAPSEPVAAAGSLYVEVPVHTYGVMKDGRSFSSAGTVTLRRKRSGSSDGKWRIYTSG